MYKGILYVSVQVFCKMYCVKCTGIATGIHSSGDTIWWSYNTDFCHFQFKSNSMGNCEGKTG